MRHHLRPRRQLLRRPRPSLGRGKLEDRTLGAAAVPVQPQHLFRGDGARQHPVHRGAAWRDARRRAGDRRRRAHPGRRRDDVLRPARRHARHLHRRRRLGARGAPDRLCPHAGHDADRPRTEGRRGRALRHRAVRGAERAADGQGQGTGPKICKNAPLSNFAITNSLPRLQDMCYDDGLYFERMVAEYTRSPESITRLHQFLDKTAPRVRPTSSRSRENGAYVIKGSERWPCATTPSWATPKPR